MSRTIKLLFIEDNVSLPTSLSGLLEHNYEITVATTGRDGIRLAGERAYDVIVLDLSLPDMSGLEVCKQVRTRHDATPILILTASAEPGTKVSLLDSGADDYMIKPFNLAEFQARIRALMRRGKADAAPAHILKIDGLSLDLSSRKVQRSGQNIELRRKEFDILEYLVRNRGKVVTRSMIIDNVWEDDGEAWDNTVNVHIKYLRDKIDRPYKHKLIKTAYGLGYTISDRL